MHSNRVIFIISMPKLHTTSRTPIYSNLNWTNVPKTYFDQNLIGLGLGSLERKINKFSGYVSREINSLINQRQLPSSQKYPQIRRKAIMVPELMQLKKQIKVLNVSRLPP